MSAKARAVLDGASLTCSTLSKLGAPGSTISIGNTAMAKVVRAREMVDSLVERGFKEGHVAYGINVSVSPTQEGLRVMGFVVARTGRRDFQRPGGGEGDDLCGEQGRGR